MKCIYSHTITKVIKNLLFLQETTLFPDLTPKKLQLYRP